MSYDTYYKTEKLFGEPYPELMDFFANYHAKGKVLDLGCGQGRDALAIAKLGYEVLGIDSSKVGIQQMLTAAEKERLKVKGQVSDIYKFDNFQNFDFVLFDSMFHFQKRDKEKETALIKRTIKNIRTGCIVIFCVQDTAYKIKVLNSTIDFENKLERLVDKKFKYIYKDNQNDHDSMTNYRMVIVRK